MRPSHPACSPADHARPASVRSLFVNPRCATLFAGLLVFFAGLFAAGCAHAPEAQPQSDQDGMQPTMEMHGDQVIRTYDLNKDGKPDDWKHFKLVPGADGQTHEVMVERELDTNFDGKVDLTTFFDDEGTRTKEIYDLDFDGKPDIIETYEHGILIQKEIFQTHREKPDAIAYYEGGQKARVERDTHGNGKVDTWEYYEGGKLSRIGEDLDGDGLVDRWIKAKSEEADDTGTDTKSSKDKPAAKPAGKDSGKPAT